MAVSCALTQDYSFGCDTGIGGVGKEMYIIEIENISSYTESSGTITAITKVATKIFRKYALVQETASFTEDYESNIQNGTLAYNQKVSIVINKQRVAVRNELLLLNVTRIAVVGQDKNGFWRLYGRVDGLKLSGGGATTGVTGSDRNGYTMDFTGKEQELAPFVADAVIATLQT